MSLELCKIKNVVTRISYIFNLFKWVLRQLSKLWLFGVAELFCPNNLTWPNFCFWWPNFYSEWHNFNNMWFHAMRGKNVDYLESKNKSLLMKNNYHLLQLIKKLTDKSEGRGSRHSGQVFKKLIVIKNFILILRLIRL